MTRNYIENNSWVHENSSNLLSIMLFFISGHAPIYIRCVKCSIFRCFVMHFVLFILKYSNFNAQPICYYCNSHTCTPTERILLQRNGSFILICVLLLWNGSFILVFNMCIIAMKGTEFVLVLNAVALCLSLIYMCSHFVFS